MAFFENIGKKIGETAQAAAKKSGDLVEVTKLNMSINSEEDKMEKLYAQLGKLVYSDFNEGIGLDARYMEICNTVMTHEQNIAAIRQKIQEIKNIKLCSNCGAELERNVAFCPSCGAQQVIPSPAPQAAPQGPVCSSCGALLTPGSVFCTNCGTKQSAPAAYEPINPIESQPAVPVCKGCNAPLQPGMQFCTNCGAKVE